MSVAVAALILALVLPLGSAMPQELLEPTSIAAAGGLLFLAYEDNTVWWAEGPLVEIPAANRGTPVQVLVPLAGVPAVHALYADKQVWTIAYPNGCYFLADVTRPDQPALSPTGFANGPSVGIVIAYEDGQIWAHDGQQLHRVEMWERPLVPTPSRGVTWGAVKKSFRTR